MHDYKPPHWVDEREEWEGDRALYELELRRSVAETGGRRARLLAGALACHMVTALLLPGGLALLAAVSVTAAAGLLLRLHFLENRDAAIDANEKLELKFPEKLTPKPPLGKE